MKYSRRQLTNEYYLIWEKEMLLLPHQNASIFSIKYKIKQNDELSQITIKAKDIHDALERACYSVAHTSSCLPEDVDLHSIYDLNGNLLWGDELFYALASSRYNTGLKRREFLTTFGLASAALLCGIHPRQAYAATTSVSLSGTASGFSYVDDIFNTYLYTGNGTTQTITTGIDLASKGGLIWFKNRTASSGLNPDHQLRDTVRGLQWNLTSNRTDIQADNTGYGPTNLTSTGFDMTGNSVISNQSGYSFAVWTFRKAAKYFDIVTYTGDGAATRSISHALGTSPGFILIKCTNANKHWVAGHYSGGTLNVLYFDSDRGSNWQGAPSVCNLLRDVDSTTFSVSKALSSYEPTAGFGDVSGATNESGKTYVAYLFAHDPTQDGVIQCGSFTTDGSGNATVNLGWEPQWLLTKDTGPGATGWILQDTARGFDMNGAKAFQANSLSTESGSANYVSPTASGFTVKGGVEGNLGQPNHNYIYVAIRRSNKLPTLGTQVFSAQAAVGTGSGTTFSGFGFPVDMAWGIDRSGSYGRDVIDRLRGKALRLNSTIAESDGGLAYTATFDSMGGFMINSAVGPWTSASSHVYYGFRRARGFFDITCISGVASIPMSVPHNLGVEPELVIQKARNMSTDDGNGNWWVSCKYLPNGLTVSEKTLQLDKTLSAISNGQINSVSTTDVKSYFAYTGRNLVIYLFASLPGVSKVGSYTGNGTSQTINCAFTTSARFILIKRTDVAGDWYIWDSVRGISSANDPHISLNSIAAEITTDDSIDPDNSGFIINQVTATNINVTGGTYIFLAIS